jgi:cytochrome bd-type quinol oxidase subunit 2
MHQEIAGLVLAAPIDNVNGVATLQGLEGLFNNLISAILALAGIVLFLLLLLGGFKYLTSGGDPKAAESARNTLTYAIFGLLIIVLSFLILLFIEDFTGAEVTNFIISR